MLVTRMVKLAALAALPLSVSCVGEPFSYAEDRCLGVQNQCQTECTSADDGAVRSACIARCYESERQCRWSGYEGSSLAVDEAIGEARTEREKEAAFQRWKARRAKKAAAKEAAQREAAEKENAAQTGAEPEAEPQD